MAKFVNDTVMDQALNYLRNNCTRVTVCSTSPTTYTEANATFALADVTVDSADFTLANGDTSGRKVTLAAQNGVTVDTTGTATTVAWLDVTGTTLLLVTDLSASQALTSGNTCNIGAHDYEIRDAA